MNVALDRPAQLTGKVVADVQAPGQSVAGDVSVRHLDLAPILNDPQQKSDITADARVDLHGEALANIDALRGTLALDVAAHRRGRLRRGTGAREGAHRRAAASALDGSARRLRRDGDGAGDRDAAGQAKRAPALDRVRPARQRAATSICGKLPRDARMCPPRHRRQRAIITSVAASVSLGTDRRGVNADLTFQPTRRSPGATIAAGSTAGVHVNGDGDRLHGRTRPSRTSICSGSASEFDVPALADGPLRERRSTATSSRAARGTTPTRDGR